MGQPHPTGRAALRMLEQEGFVFDRYIDIFDGGPTVTARDRPDPHDPRSARARRSCEIGDGGQHEDAGRDRPAERLPRLLRVGQDASPTKGVCIDRGGAPSCSTSRSATRSSRSRAEWRSREINFDGIVGPSHNYAGLSLGNLASTRNAGRGSQPRAAALQGVDKMRANLALGLAQGIFLPHPRPDRAWLAELGTDDRGGRAGARRQRDVGLGDVGGQCRDRLARARHRRRQLPPDRRQPAHHAAPQPRMAGDAGAAAARLRGPTRFAVHGPVPPAFGDEGAANHMRLAAGARRAGRRGLRLWRVGRRLPGAPASSRRRRRSPGCTGSIPSGPCSPSNRRRRSPPARSTMTSSRSPTSACCSRTSRRSPTSDALIARLRAAGARASNMVEVPDAEVPLADAIRSYLFNAQLVTPARRRDDPDRPRPRRARRRRSGRWIERHLAGNGPIRRVEVVDVRQSMANGGGPACLRLRVVADPATVDPRFLVDEAKLDRIADVIARALARADPPRRAAAAGADRATSKRARAALLEALDLAELA